MARNFLFGVLVGSSLYAAVKWIHDLILRKRKKVHENEDDCFLFSPQRLMIQCIKNQSDPCKFLSCPVCNYKRYVSLIQNAKTHLDVCVYLITSEELTKVLISLFYRGVFVRIIIDKQMSDDAFNSKACVFIKEHIPIKIVNTGEIMHNKFVIIDQKVVVTGSFNWTRQATSCNYENGVVIHNAEIVGKFREYFGDIWLTS